MKTRSEKRYGIAQPQTEWKSPRSSVDLTGDIDIPRDRWLMLQQTMGVWDGEDAEVKERLMQAFNDIWYSARSPTIRKTLMKSKYDPSLPNKLIRAASAEVDEKLASLRQSVKNLTSGPSTSKDQSSPVLRRYREYANSSSEESDQDDNLYVLPTPPKNVPVPIEPSPYPSGQMRLLAGDRNRKVQFKNAPRRAKAKVIQEQSQPNLIRIPKRPELLEPTGVVPSIKQMESFSKTVPVCPESNSILTWLINALNSIPHGNGSTPSDKLLANKFCERLLEAKTNPARQVADAISSQLVSPEFRWRTLIEVLTRSFPQGKGYLSQQIMKAISLYDWRQDAPMLKLQPVFRAAGISLDQTIGETPQGHSYLSQLRLKLPVVLRFVLKSKEDETWAELFQTLQDYRNQELEDQSVNSQFQTTPFDQDIKRRENVQQPAFPAVNPQTSFNRNNARRSVRNTPQTRRYGLRNLPGRPSQTMQNTPPTPPNSQPLQPQNMNPMTFEAILGLSQEFEPCNCFSCGRYGHKQHDCPIGAFLDLKDLRLKQTGDHVGKVPKGTTPELRLRQQQRWGSWLQGQNPLGKVFTSLNDFNTILQQANEPTVQESFKRVGQIKRPPHNMRYRAREQRMSGNPWPPAPTQMDVAAPPFASQRLNY